MTYTKKIAKYIDEYFTFLINESGFTKVKEKFDDQSLEVIFESPKIKIMIEKYHRELYMEIAPTPDPEHWANIDNIIQFINKDKNKIFESKLFREIENLDECFRLQVEGLAQLLREHLPSIIKFLKPDCYKQNLEELREFVINRDPHLFKRQM